MAADVAQSIAAQTCTVTPNASVLYGWYTGLVYLTPLFGGLIADRYLGQKKAVYVGGVLMALGQFVLFGSDNLFFVGLLLLIIGNGFFKPNISTQVGNLYPPGDPRRDGAFTIFYMGINLGAFICNFVCGTLAAVYGWRYGFLAAGIGMCIGLVVQLLRPAATWRPTRCRSASAAPRSPPKQTLTGERVEARLGAGRAVRAQHRLLGRLRAAGQHDADVGRREDVLAGSWASSTWFQSVNPFFIFLFAPFLDRFWAMAEPSSGKEPSSVAKMAIGCIILGLSFIVMVRRRPDRGRRQGQPVLAGVLHAAADHRRALPVADRPLAGDEGVAGAHRLDDDGHVVPVELLRQHPLAATSAALHDDVQGRASSSSSWCSASPRASRSRCSTSR